MASRFVSVDGELLRRLRIDCMMSQAELARRAGYSARLVRKAEAGKSLAIETVHSLVETLREAGAKVSFAYLTKSHLGLARMFVESYDRFGRGMVNEIAGVVSSDFVFQYPGNPEQICFAGDWVGLNGLRRFLELFFTEFRRTPNTLSPRYLVNEDCVSCHYVENLQRGGRAMNVWVNLHFSFAHGSIGRVEHEYDTKAVVDLLKFETKSNLMSSGSKEFRIDEGHAKEHGPYDTDLE